MRLFRNKQSVPVRVPRQEDHATYTFRRSRTLTGSSSETVRTVSETRAHIKSPRLKEHELRTHRRRLGSYLLGVIGATVALLLLLNQFIGVIRFNVQSQSPLARAVDEMHYITLLNSYFLTHPSERFRFALNTTTLNTYMAQKAPEVASVTFEQTGLITAYANVRFREPVVVWQLSGKRSYVDGQGRSFLINYYNEPTIAVKDDSGLESNGGTVVSDRFLQFMGRVIALTNDSGSVRITGATLPRGYAREIDYTLEGRAYRVKTQLGRDAASQVADIVNAVKYIDSKNLKPEYVDVRVPSKAAYR